MNDGLQAELAGITIGPQKKLLKDFMAEKELPDEISQAFLTAIQQAFFDYINGVVPDRHDWPGPRAECDHQNVLGCRTRARQTGHD